MMLTAATAAVRVWFPAALAPVAARLGRADELEYELGMAELDHLHSFVADTAVPTLVTGSAPVTPALARQVRLDDTGETLSERVEHGSGWFSAKVRVQGEIDQAMLEMGSQPVPTLPVTD
jgi:hypothetical protein